MKMTRKSFLFRGDDCEIIKWIVSQTNMNQTDIVRISIRLLRDGVLHDTLGKYESIFSGIKTIKEVDDLLSRNNQK